VPHAVYPVDYGCPEGTAAADGDGVDVVRGSAGAGVAGFFVTADPGKRDVEVKVLRRMARRRSHQAAPDAQSARLVEVRRPDEDDVWRLAREHD